MDNQEVKHYQVNGKYRIVIEQAASTKGTLGFKVEANGDEINKVEADIEGLMMGIKHLIQPPVSSVENPPKS